MKHYSTSNEGVYREKVKIRVLIMGTRVNFCGKKQRCKRFIWGDIINEVARRKANGRLADIFSEKEGNYCVKAKKERLYYKNSENMVKINDR